MPSSEAPPGGVVHGAPPTDANALRELSAAGGRFRPWEYLAAAFALALFFLIRFPLLTEDNAVRGWNSDAAVFGLLARRLLGNGQAGVFFWGQNYMGPLTSLGTAAIVILRHAVGLGSGTVDMLSLRLGSLSEVAFGILLFWLGLRAAVGRSAAAAALLLLAIGPRFLVNASLAGIGDEIGFVCSGALFYLGARSLAGERRPALFASAGGCLLLGLAAGFGWWMNQGVVFVLLPLAIVLVLRSRAWAGLYPTLKPVDRLLVRSERLGWKPLAPAVENALRVWHALLVGLLVLALLREAGFSVPTFFFHDARVEPIVLLLLTAVVLESTRRGDLSRLVIARTLTGLPGALARVAAFAGGFLLGYLPVPAGRLFGWYEVTYGRPVFDVGLDGVASHLWQMAQGDLWRWVGADRSVCGIVFVVGGAAGLLLFAWDRREAVSEMAALRPGQWGAEAFAGWVMVVAVGFYSIALRHGGDPRYIGPALPVAYGLAAAGLLGTNRDVRRRNTRRLALVLFVVCGLVSLGRQARERVRAVEAEPDPRVLIAAIERQGYRVCYAGFWDAYKLQLISDERLRFIPYRTHDRNPVESRRIAALPEAKCLLFPDGTFRRFVPADLPPPVVHSHAPRSPDR